MAYETGIDGYFKVDGSSMGLVNGGRMVIDSEVREINAVGDFEPTQLREGMSMCYGNVDLFVQDLAILSLAERSVAGVLDDFHVEGGGDDEGQKHFNCKVDTITITAMAGGELRCSMSWRGKYGDQTAGGTYTPSTDAILMWFEGTLSGISGVELVAATINVSHNTNWQPIIQSSGTPKRSPKYVIEKRQRVMATLRFLEQETVSLKADSIALIAAVTLAFAGDNNVTIQLTNLKRGSQEEPFIPTDLITRGATYVATGWSVS